MHVHLRSEWVSSFERNLRIGGIATGRLPQRYYGLFRESDDREPDRLRLISWNYHNLLEVPIRFYVSCLIAYRRMLVGPGE